MRRTGTLAFILAIVCAAPALADVKRAESILPPGESGFVSIPGVASGTGSPHLYDQLGPFVDFKRKPATFGQEGTPEEPRAGVRIVRDRFGVPAVTGTTEADMWWGMGYAVAQDRLFQLDLFRRATSGRLAEILGEGYLDDDLIARRDYYTDDEIRAMVASAGPTFQARATAYRDGINAWVAHVRTDPSNLPGEYPATGAPLEDWTIEDTARVGVFLARTVPSSDGVELDNLRAVRAIGQSAFDRLLPLRTPRQITTVPPDGTAASYFPSQPGRKLTAKRKRAALRKTLAAAKDWQLPAAPKAEAAGAARSRTIPQLPGQTGGSSMFAVQRKGDHHAFLFNGPQLGFSVPELFWEVELHAPGFDARGVTAPGIPLIGIGHNGSVAWGFTSGLSDEDDLYAEQLVSGQPERYRFRGEERAMTCRDEKFTFRSPPTDALKFPDAVPGAGERTERICRTQHGPVQARAGNQAYARRYAIWGRQLETIVGLDGLNRARTVEDVDRAMQNVTWNENVMAVDSAGSIGFWHPGLHPLRPRDFDERLPYPGTGEAEWRGLLDRRATPHVINPKQGYLVNWNNPASSGWTAGDGEAREKLTGHFHRVGWLQRLVRRLAKSPSFEGAQEVVESEGSTAQQRPIAGPALRRARRGATGRAATLLDALLRWDGNYTRSDGNGTVDPGVAIWEQFKAEAQRLALADVGGADAVALAGTPGTSHHFDITNGEAYALRSLSLDGYRRAADAAFAALAKQFGTDDVTRWREKRFEYEVSAQGAGSPPPLPFFDRGTWEQIVEVGP